jgi:antitoxin CptB
VNTHQADPHQRARLKWRARRGLLENDLMLTRYFQMHELTMTDADVTALDSLLALTDNDLLDLFLARKAPEGELNNADVLSVLSKVQHSPIAMIQTKLQHAEQRNTTLA